MAKLARFQDGIPIVASDAERASLFASPDTNQRVYNLTSRQIERYSGSRWLAEIRPHPTGRLFLVDDYGAIGDGTTNDIDAFTAAEDARVANGGGVLAGTAGKTYALGTNTAADLFTLRVAGLVDFTGATLKYTHASNLTTGTDGGGLGVVNVLADGVEFRGTIDCNEKARYGLAFKSQMSGCRLDVEIQNTLEASSVWTGFSYACSADVTGTAISGRAKNIRGFLSRPDCPFVNTSNVITANGDVSAVLIGGNIVNTNATGAALVMGSPQWNVYVAKPDTLGIMLTPKEQEDNSHWLDWIAHDIGCNQIECYGHDTQYGDDFGLPENDSPGFLGKSGAVISAYHTGYKPSAAGHEYPCNVYIKGGSTGDDPDNVSTLGASTGDGIVQVNGAMWSRPVVLTYSASMTADISKANRFKITATNNTNFTIENPTVPSTTFNNNRKVRDGQEIEYVILNSSGGALGTLTWGTKFRTAGAWTQPANGTRRVVRFFYDGVADLWIECFRSAADVTS